MHNYIMTYYLITNNNNKYVMNYYFVNNYIMNYYFLLLLIFLAIIHFITLVCVIESKLRWLAIQRNITLQLGLCFNLVDSHVDTLIGLDNFALTCYSNKFRLMDALTNGKCLINMWKQEIFKKGKVAYNRLL